jgi:NFU1 iron-sulfur cluster scaffold homolog, mitochondrial
VSHNRFPSCYFYQYFQAKNKEEIKRSSLAKSLFSTNGISGLFFGRDFITITKNTNEVWNVLKPIIFSKILDFYAEGKPIILKELQVSDTTVLPDDSEIVATIKELLETKIRPNVQDDGGDIFYEGFDEETGIVKVSLAGSCVGCPSSKVTLKQGVETMLMHYIPEVKGVEETVKEENDEPLVLRPEADGGHVHSDSCKH